MFSILWHIQPEHLSPLKSQMTTDILKADLILYVLGELLFRLPPGIFPALYDDSDFFVIPGFITFTDICPLLLDFKTL